MESILWLYFYFACFQEHWKYIFTFGNIVNPLHIVLSNSDYILSKKKLSCLMVSEHEGPLKGGYSSTFLVPSTVLSIQSVKSR